CARALLLGLIAAPLDCAWSDLGPAELPMARPGAVLLLPMRCMLCSAIAGETGSEYAHSGVLIRSPQGEWAVAQALGRVHRVPLAQFLKLVAPGKRPGLYRHRLVARWPKRAQVLWALFHSSFQGLDFDPLFLWDNR